jgi:hypothetical protein
MIANGSVNADIQRYPDADGIVNGHTSGSNILYGHKYTPSDSLIVSSENGTTLKNQALSAISADAMYYHDLEQKIYFCKSGGIDAWRVDNPLSPYFNGTTPAHGTGKCTYYDEGEDAIFLSTTTPSAYTSIAADHSATSGWGENTVPARCVVDKATIGSETYYFGAWNSNFAGPHYFVTMDENYDVVKNITAASGITDCDPVGWNDYEDHFFVINEDYAINSNNDGTGIGAPIISINDFNDFSELAVGCGPTFYPLDAYGLDYIIGFDIVTDTFHICNITEITAISTEDTGIYIGYNETNIGAPDIKIIGPGRVILGDNPPNPGYLWDLQAQAAEGAGDDAVNTPPTYSGSFLGLDEAEENFVFEITITDAEGGNMFYAFDTTPGNDTDFFDYDNQRFDFNSFADLDYVARPGCPTYYNRSSTDDFYPYMLDGSLYLDPSCPGLWPTEITFTELGEPSIAENNEIIFATMVGYQNNTAESAGVSSLALLDQDGTIINLMAIAHDFTNNTLTISGENGVEGSGVLDEGEPLFVIIHLYPYNDTIFVEAFNFADSGKLDITYLENISDDTTTVEKVIFNDYATSNLETYIDFVSWSLVVDLDVTEDIDLEPYIFFNYNPAGAAISKAHYEPITGGFGNYQAFLYATDATLGTDYYGDGFPISWYYSASTPTYTDEEISDLIASLSESEYVEGDLATDYIPAFLQEAGLTTTGSKMIVGFVILVGIGFIVASWGAAVAVLILGAAFIVLSIIGLFPIWFVTIMVIIAAVLVATSFRNLLQGGGGS